MAYQNVGVPIFYVNVIEWLLTTGAIKAEEGTFNNTSFGDSIFRTLPVSPSNLAYGVTQITSTFNTFNDNSFVALLGTESLSTFYINIWNGLAEFTPIINGYEGTDLIDNAAFDGFSIATFNGTGSAAFQIVKTGNISSLVLGTYYKMTNAPNLDLTFSQEYGSTKEQTAYDGSSISNTQWTSPPLWNNAAAWEIYNPNTNDGQYTTHKGTRDFARTGRRVYQLTFSYMDRSDLWGSNQSLSKRIFSMEGYSGNDIVGSSYSDAADFYSDIESPDTIHGYETFDGESLTGFHAIHSTSGSKAQSDNSVIIAEGLQNIVSFNLTLTSGVAPFIDIRLDMDITTVQTEEGFTRAVEGYNELTFTPTHFSTPQFHHKIIFRHENTDEDSEFTISELAVQIGTSPSFKHNLLTDDNFFSQVWHKTLGGTIPFLFQPDSTNNNSDQFSICRFKENSLKVNQSAFNMYDVSVTIEESF